MQPEDDDTSTILDLRARRLRAVSLRLPRASPERPSTAWLLSANRLCAMPAPLLLNALNDLSCLRLVDLSHNRLEFFPMHLLLHAPALRSLDLSWNRLRDLPTDVPSEATPISLRTLSLARNYIRIIPYGFVACLKLDVFDISANPLAPEYQHMPPQIASVHEFTAFQTALPDSRLDKQVFAATEEFVAPHRTCSQVVDEFLSAVPFGQGYDSDSKSDGNESEEDDNGTPRFDDTDEKATNAAASLLQAAKTVYGVVASSHPEQSAMIEACVIRLTAIYLDSRGRGSEGASSMVQKDSGQVDDKHHRGTRHVSRSLSAQACVDLIAALRIALETMRSAFSAETRVTIQGETHPPLAVQQTRGYALALFAAQTELIAATKILTEVRQLRQRQRWRAEMVLSEHGGRPRSRSSSTNNSSTRNYGTSEQDGSDRRARDEGTGGDVLVVAGHDAIRAAQAVLVLLDAEINNSEHEAVRKRIVSATDAFAASLVRASDAVTSGSVPDAPVLLETPSEIHASQMLASDATKLSAKLADCGNKDIDPDAHVQLADYAFQLYQLRKSRHDAAAELSDVIVNSAQFIDWVYSYIDAENAKLSGSRDVSMDQPQESSKKRPPPQTEESATEVAGGEDPKPTKPITKIVWDLAPTAAATATAATTTAKTRQQQQTGASKADPPVSDDKKRLRGERFGASNPIDSQSSQKPAIGIVGRSAAMSSTSISAPTVSGGGGIHTRLGRNGLRSGSDFSDRLGAPGNPAASRPVEEDADSSGSIAILPQNNDRAHGGSQQGFSNNQFPPRQQQWRDRDAHYRQQQQYNQGYQRNNKGSMGVQPYQQGMMYGALDQFGNFVPWNNAMPAMGLPLGAQNGIYGVQPYQHQNPYSTYGRSSTGSFRGGLMQGRGGNNRTVVQIRPSQTANQVSGSNGVSRTEATDTGPESEGADAKIDIKADDAGAESEDAAEFVMEGTQTSLPASSQSTRADAGGFQFSPAAHQFHPQSQQQRPLCRFGDACTRTQCAFLHPWEMIPKKGVCRFGDTCQTFRCAFWHSWDGGEPPVGFASSGPSSVSNIPCRYGALCNKLPNCPFKHTTAGFSGHKTLVLNKPTSEPSDHELKTGVSERVFAVSEGETERVIPSDRVGSGGGLVGGDGGVTIGVRKVDGAGTVFTGSGDNATAGINSKDDEELLIDEEALL
ncbi:hypothetical protein HDU83_005487 [Entophlyctis luteolus]|nr:hypothetical protein HDU83_005487 [Entophlyctis luteolus]